LPYALARNRRGRSASPRGNPASARAPLAVAPGAFSGLLSRMSAVGAALPVDELGDFTREQVF
jgi:hypothetical protein